MRSPDNCPHVAHPGQGGAFVDGYRHLTQVSVIHENPRRSQVPDTAMTEPSGLTGTCCPVLHPLHTVSGRQRSSKGTTGLPAPYPRGDNMSAKDGPFGRRLQVGDRVGVMYEGETEPSPVNGWGYIEPSPQGYEVVWYDGFTDVVQLDDRAQNDGRLVDHGIDDDARVVRVDGWFRVRALWAVLRLALRRWTRPLRPVKRGAR